MPRRQIPFTADCYYHIYNRGNNRQTIFFQPENYLYFLSGIKKYILPEASIIAYCLMPTHYHILIRVRNQTSEFLKNSEVCISGAMMRLSVSYTKAINKRFQRVGTLFQGQFRAKPIQQYGHLINLCVYIHANPVKDGIVQNPADWIYSNYSEWLGKREGTLVDRDFIQDHFGGLEEYRSIVMDYIKYRAMPEDVNEYLRSLEK